MSAARRALSGAAVAGAAAASAVRRRLRARRRIGFRGRTVLITGGSRGLGLELARRFAYEGARLALLARDPDELERARRQLAALGARVTTHVADVARAEDVRRAVDEVLAATGRIDVLVNNAGVIRVGPLDHVADRDLEESLGVHVWGPFRMSRAVIPEMRARGGGRIVNIASIGGKVSVPHLLTYCVGKFGLVGLSEGLRPELARDRIYVTTVVPGLMRTGSHFNAWFKGRHEREFALFSILNASPLLSIASATAARRIVEACRNGDAVVFLNFQARWLERLNAALPGAVAGLEALASRLLPGPAGPAGDRARQGWRSRSALAPSILTRPADRAAPRNNQRPPGEDDGGIRPATRDRRVRVPTTPTGR